jgi:hypothetical protein
MTQRDRDALEDLFLDYVWEAYRTWVRSGFAGREPSITVTKLLDYALQHGKCPNCLKHMSRRRQHSAAYSVVRRAFIGGRLDRSAGVGERGRTEVWCYEPSRPEGQAWEQLFHCCERR